MLSTPRNGKTRRPPRTRSCTLCIQAKRRCDPGPLACQRCTKQGLECRYLPPVNTANKRSHSSISMAIEENVAAPEQPVQYLHSEQSDLFDDIFLPNGPCNISSMSDVYNLEIASFDQPSSPTLFTLPAAVDQRLFELPDFSASRLNYGIGQLKMAPSRMVLESQAPWSHPLLYEDKMPISMHDALASCSLYMAKNDANSKFVLRHIRLRARELLAGPHTGAPLDLLSRTQALLLYQIILVFDGDILARAQAEVAIPQLESFALSIKSLLNEDEETMPLALPIYPTGPAKTLWKSWIFRESARRTFLICYFFLSLYHSLKGNAPYCHDHAEVPSEWTASAHLWNAPSVFDFVIAWKDKRHLVIQNLNHTPLLVDGDPSEVDTFGRIVIVTQLGIDDARGWFYSRGGCL